MALSVAAVTNHAAHLAVIKQVTRQESRSSAGSCHADRWILYELSHKENPRILEWVAYPFSRGSSQPRD